MTMPLRKVYKILEEYSKLIGFVEPIRLPDTKKYKSQLTDVEILRHLNWMIDEMARMNVMQRDKIMRWFGFIQGVMFMISYKSIEDLKNDSRPTEEEQNATEEDGITPLKQVPFSEFVSRPVVARQMRAFCPIVNCGWEVFWFKSFNNHHYHQCARAHQIMYHEKFPALRWYTIDNEEIQVHNR